MKVSVPIVFAAAAGLVSAAPIVVVYAPKPRPVPDVDAWAQNVRWGHAAANAGFLPPIRTTPTPTGYSVYEAIPMAQYSHRPASTGWSFAPNPTMGPAPTGYWTGSPPDPTPNREWIAYGERLRAEIEKKMAGPNGDRLRADLKKSMEGVSIKSSMMRKGGCHMRKMRYKSLQWGNKLRVILGLPPIEPFGNAHRNPHASPVVYITTFDSHGGEHREYIPEERWLRPQHRHHTRPSHHDLPFHVRLAYALSSLGPWEGRAVSFVLGCGLGVLLRMLYVFGVLIVRGARCRRAERRIALVDDSVIFAADIKEPVAVEALPEYAEKVETTAVEVPQTNNAH